MRDLIIINSHDSGFLFQSRRYFTSFNINWNNLRIIAVIKNTWWLDRVQWVELSVPRSLICIEFRSVFCDD